MVEDRNFRALGTATGSEQPRRRTERKTWRRRINAGLRQAYDAVVNEPVPEDFHRLLAAESARPSSGGRQESQL